MAIVRDEGVTRKREEPVANPVNQVAQDYLDAWQRRQEEIDRKSPNVGWGGSNWANDAWGKQEEEEEIPVYNPVNVEMPAEQEETDIGAPPVKAPKIETVQAEEEPVTLNQPTMAEKKAEEIAFPVTKPVTAKEEPRDKPSGTAPKEEETTAFYGDNPVNKQQKEQDSTAPQSFEQANQVYKNWYDFSMQGGASDADSTAVATNQVYEYLRGEGVDPTITQNIVQKISWENMLANNGGVPTAVNGAPDPYVLVRQFSQQGSEGARDSLEKARYDYNDAVNRQMMLDTMRNTTPDESVGKVQGEMFGNNGSPTNPVNLPAPESLGDFDKFAYLFDHAVNDLNMTPQEASNYATQNMSVELPEGTYTKSGVGWRNVDKVVDQTIDTLANVGSQIWFDKDYQPFTAQKFAELGAVKPESTLPSFMNNADLFTSERMKYLNEAIGLGLSGQTAENYADAMTKARSEKVYDFINPVNAEEQRRQEAIQNANLYSANTEGQRRAEALQTANETFANNERIERLAREAGQEDQRRADALTRAEGYAEDGTYEAGRESTNDYRLSQISSDVLEDERRRADALANAQKYAEDGTYRIGRDLTTATREDRRRQDSRSNTSRLETLLALGNPVNNTDYGLALAEANAEDQRRYQDSQLGQMSPSAFNVYNSMQYMFPADMAFDDKVDFSNRAGYMMDNLPADWTDKQKYQYIFSLTDGDGKLRGFDYEGAIEGWLPDDLAVPYISQDGTGMNDALDAILHSTEPQYNDKGELIGEKYVYKPADPTNEEEARSYADRILALFADNNLREGDTPFKGLENIPEECWEIVADFVGGGDPARARDDKFKIEYVNMPEQEYQRLAELFVHNVPALEQLVQGGFLSYSDIVRFFFKQRADGSKSKKSGSGYGYGGRYYGGGGGGRSYGGSRYSGGSSYPSSGTNKSQNRVYNIMKNWSF